MYGASGKMGRGGGGGSGGKRNIHAPPIGRPTPASRLSMGGGPRGRGGPSASSPSTSSLQVEESFSLVREDPLNFGMAIKLTTELVEEIKRVEAQGGTARIKFGANASGNVIHVGDKTIKFSWATEPGDLCDIYEERQSGDGGDGLLVESGGTWRKLNVERELDESTKNHVKRRSEEAERKLKSRKAIVLDHQNPAMKNQMKAFAASESTQWRSFKNRKEPPFKKPKSDPTSASGPPKSVFKPNLPVQSLPKGRLSSSSPLSSQPERHGPSTSPVGTGDLVKGHTIVSDSAATQNPNKLSSFEKDKANRRNSTVSEKSKFNRNIEAKPADLRSLITSLLVEHQSTGMSLKALEKAVGDAMPNSARKIEPILNQIANCQAHGRYFLKSGMDIESFKKLPQTGSSPEINHDQSPVPQKFEQLPGQDPGIHMITDANNEEQGELNPTPTHAADIIEKIGTQNSPENLSDKNVSNNSEGVAGSSSDSGSDSDSDSDSSDSGSDSGSPSKSKSRSPVVSRSGSSSDSDSDASSSSKHASDEDVDIMTSGDEKESKHKLQDPDPASLRYPGLWNGLDNDSVDIGNSEIQDHFLGEIEIDIDKDSPEHNHGAEMPSANHLFASKEGEEPTEEIKPSSPHHHEQQESRVFERKGYDGSGSNANDGFKHGQSGTQGRSLKGNSKRRADDKHLDERTHSRKKSKSKKSIEPVSGTINSLFGESPYNLSPDRQQGADTQPADLMEDRTNRNDANYHDLQTGTNHQAISHRPVSDSQQTAQRFSEARGWAEVRSGEKRPGKHNGLDRGVKYSDRSLQSIEDPQIHKGFNTDAQSEDGLLNEQRQLKISAEGVGDKHAPIIETNTRKSEMTGKVKEITPSSNSYRGYSPKSNNPNTADGPPVMNGRNGILRREYSDLELGEFREPFHEDAPASKKQFERKSSFKQLENKQVDAEYWNSDLSGGKPSNKIPVDLGRMSPPNADANISSNPEGPYRRKSQENYVDDLTRPQHRSNRPLDAHHHPRGDFNSQQNTVPEVSGKTRFAEAGMGRAASIEAYGDTSRKIPANSTEQQHEPIRGVEPRATKQSKKQKPNRTGISNDRRIDALTESSDSHQKKKLSSSDETSCSFSKFEKEEPELKGPIRDISQYKEYVKEYQEKYEGYCSLNKILESYRDEFSKLGKDLEACKGRDMKKYNDILEQMRSSFRQCGEKHKRLKKIFVVLYEELKHLKQMIKDYATPYKKD